MTEGVISKSKRIARQKQRLAFDAIMRAPSIERAGRERGRDLGEQLRDLLFAPVELGGVSDGETLE